MKVGREIYFCFVKDNIGYNKKGTATITLCKKAIDRASKGEKIDLILGKGILIREDDHSCLVQINEIFTQSDTYSVHLGQNQFSTLWIKLGNYARTKLLIFNPSYRQLSKLKKHIKENELKG